jgi:N-acyl-L-homoserine lactone synthetase
MDARDVRFTIADGSRTLRAVHRLRYDVYVREFGFFSPVKHTDDLLVDAFDGAGLHPIALEGDEVVGALRLVLHSERGFPLAHVLPPFPLSRPARKNRRTLPSRHR